MVFCTDRFGWISNEPSRLISFLHRSGIHQSPEKHLIGYCWNRHLILSCCLFQFIQICPWMVKDRIFLCPRYIFLCILTLLFLKKFLVSSIDWEIGSFTELSISSKSKLPNHLFHEFDNHGNLIRLPSTSCHFDTPPFFCPECHQSDGECRWFELYWNLYLRTWFTWLASSPCLVFLWEVIHSVVW